MARIRSVHPGFFTDEDLVEVSAFARLFIIGLGVHADDKGVFEWKPKTLKMKIFPSETLEVSELLAELLGVDAIASFEIGGRKYGAIRNFRKMQRPKTPNDIHPITSEFRIYVGLDAPISEEIPKRFPKASEIAIQMEDVGGKERCLSESVPTPAPKPKKSKRETYPDDFEEFWTDYPTDALMSKKEAGSAWKRLDQADREQAFKSIPAFRAYCQAEADYRPLHAVRYLKQRRFDGFAEVASKSEARIFVEAGTPDWSGAVVRFEAENGRPPTPRDHKGKRGWWFPKAWIEERTQ